MKNPFKIDTENDRHIFFKDMSDAINAWMLEKYPAFDTLLEQKIQEILRLQNEFKMLIGDFKNDARNLRKKETDEFIQEIKKFMSKEYPEVKSSLITLSKKIENRIKDRKKIDDKNDEKIENLDIQIKEKMKTICSSQTLYEDVYKLRDEFNGIKEFMDKFQKKIKKAFEI